jgi:hypothetical protein
MDSVVKLGELVRLLQAALVIAGDEATVSCMGDSSGGYGFSNQVKGLSHICIPNQSSKGMVTIAFWGR